LTVLGPLYISVLVLYWISTGSDK